MDELLSGTAARLKGETTTNSVFVHPLPFNLIPHIDKFQVRLQIIFVLSTVLLERCLQSNGYTKEEMKVVWETQKIFGLTDADISISCTAVRIPTLRAHSESITLETELPVSLDEARYAFFFII